MLLVDSNAALGGATEQFLDSWATGARIPFDHEAKIRITENNTNRKEISNYISTAVQNETWDRETLVFKNMSAEEEEERSCFL